MEHHVSVRFTISPKTLSGTSEKVVLERLPFEEKSLTFWEEFKSKG